MKRRLFFALLAIAVLLLALGGWAVDALRPTRANAVSGTTTNSPNSHRSAGGRHR
jgi:hypothetical protein